ncbi:MAG TPA: hypothetical protein VGF89_00930 [Steroidobacteraceae bacterium]
MTDFVFPPWARCSNAQYTAVSNTGVSRSVFTGATRSIGRTGDRLLVSFNVLGASDRAGSAERAAVRAVRLALRGQGNRLFWGDPSYAARGSFPDGELLQNYQFLQGTTGWTAGATGGSDLSAISASDNVLRILRVDASPVPQAYQTVACIQYAPYVARAHGMNGRGNPPRMQLIDGTYVGGGVSTLALGPGMIIASLVPLNTQATIGLYSSSGDGAYFPGDYNEYPYASLTRCILSDGGGNAVQFSDQLDNAAWTKAALGVTANATNAPDGTATADALIPTTASSQHSIAQSVTGAAQGTDWSVCGAFKADGYNFVALQILEASGSTVVNQTFNLNTGAIGATANTGAGWSNRRAFISSLGNGWYYCCLVAHKGSGTGTVTPAALSCSTDSVANFAGNGTSGTFGWRLTFAQSSVPQRLVASTTAVNASAQATGAIYVKGLPASTNGLLLPGDIIQSGNEINCAISALNSDAAGLGYLALYRPFKNAPADDSPIIVTRPMGRFVLTANDQSQGNTHWQDSPGIFTDYTFEIEEALDV